MTLRYEDKLQIHQLEQKGYSVTSLSRTFHVHETHLRYMLKLIERRYGIEQEIMEKVLMEGQSMLSVSLDSALPNRGALSKWLSQYKKNKNTIVEKQRRRPPKMGHKPKKTWEEMTELEQLQEENERLRTEVAYLKKLKETDYIFYYNHKRIKIKS